ncbi:MAG: hypothetical protein IJY28_10580 [Clostridia bacterium]|nr:hypothetical protein [Clostridia bacterium]
MKKCISLLLVLLLALGCMGTMTGCSRLTPVSRFEDAVDDLVKYFTDFTDMNNLFPAMRDHSCVEGTFSASGGTDASENNFSGTFQADGKNHLGLLKMNLPLALLGADTSVKADVSVALKDGNAYIGFPGTTDYVMMQTGGLPMLAPDDVTDLYDALKNALKKATTKKNVSMSKENITVAGIADTEAIRLTMVLNADETAALLKNTAKAFGNASLTTVLGTDVLTANVTTMQMSVFVVEGQTVRTEVRMAESTGTELLLTLTTEGTDATAEWIASLTRTAGSKETELLTATGDRKDSETGTAWSFEQLTPTESGSHDVLRLNFATSLNPDSGALVNNATLYTSVDGVETETPISLNGVITDDKFRGTLTLTATIGATRDRVPLTVQVDLTFSNRLKVNWTMPDSKYIVTETDATEETEKYQQFAADLFEKYPEILDVLTGQLGESSGPSGNFMLSNSDSTDLFLFYDNNTGIHRMVLPYTQDGNTISAAGLDGKTISFTYDPGKDTQIVTIDGVNYQYSVTDGNIMLKSDAAWTQILIYGETMMLVDRHFNYMISGDVLTTYSGLNDAPVDRKFTSDGQFYYIDEAPYSYSSLDAAG